VLGTAQLPAAYPLLQTIVEDPIQNTYLQFHCLKALRLLDPQRFAGGLTTASDSATAPLGEATTHINFKDIAGPIISK
jgi:hypothetical protein